MPLTIQDLVTVTSADEVIAEVLSLCASADPPLPTTSWQEGATVLTMIDTMSTVTAMRTETDVEMIKGGFGDLANPDWLKLWAKAIYDVDFVPAEAATGFVNLVNSSATNFPLNPGDLIVAHQTTGQTYRNQVAIVIPGSGSLSNVAIQADNLGTIGDAAPGEISVRVSNLLGVTVTNPQAVLGADEELPTALLARTRAKLQFLSPKGAKGAYDYVVQTPSLNPTSTPITRSRTTGDPLTGFVTVYCATAGGAPTVGDVAICQTSIDFWAEPWCVTSTAVSANNLIINITYAIWISSSLTAAQIESLIAIALTTYLASVPVGGFVVPPDTGKVYQEELSFVIRSAVPGIRRVLLSAPVGDLAMTPDQVPVLGTITPTVNFL